jgi:hypothetical protein
MSLFKELYHRDVNKNLESINGANYLSWSYAWAEIKKVDEKASVKIHEFPMLDADFRVIEGVTVPYLKTPEGYFVKVSVTIHDHTETEMLPVIDNKNVPLGTFAPVWVKKDKNSKAVKEYSNTPNPTSMDINTSHKRCMVKAIALHGLGLYVYNGEGNPEVDEEVLKKQHEEFLKQQEELKKQQEEERKNFISLTKELANQHPDLSAKLAELEHKARQRIDQFDRRLSERAWGVLSALLTELEEKEAV